MKKTKKKQSLVFFLSSKTPNWGNFGAQVIWCIFALICIKELRYVNVLPLWLVPGPPQLFAIFPSCSVCCISFWKLYNILLSAQTHSSPVGIHTLHQLVPSHPTKDPNQQKLGLVLVVFMASCCVLFCRSNHWPWDLWNALDTKPEAFCSRSYFEGCTRHRRVWLH